MNAKKQYIAPQVKKLSAMEVAQKVVLKTSNNYNPVRPAPTFVLKTN